MDDPFLQPLIECLHYSPFAIALTKIENVPLVHLSKAYSTASYQQVEEMIKFEIDTKKTQITKSQFISLLGIPLGCDLVDPESVSNSAILEMFFQIGYKECLAVVLKFKKPNLLPRWNVILT
ncbi:unnamed protein product [Lactuca saligna]|uniref:Uncharacterized protein n=1 Tax=Lactuca saligna TaxID=75948 RepID=A0AA35YMP1_LACSI|nr:unnamed protein product [Lactuca saligna]